jgi:outer membrane cobalamin receptor
MTLRILALALLSLLSYEIVHADTEDDFELNSHNKERLVIRAASVFPEVELDSSATVGVVTRADWEERGARLIPDALQHLPGVVLNSSTATGIGAWVRTYQTFSAGGQATILDGIPLNTFTFDLAVFSNAELQLPILDRIELVRGPSSILYGSDALHSAIVLSTYSDFTSQFQVEGSMGERDYSRLGFRGTYALDASETLQGAFSFADQGDQDYDYKYPLPGGAVGSGERQKQYRAASGMLRWEKRGEDIDSQIEYIYDHTDAHGFAGVGTAFILDTLDHDQGGHFNNFSLVKGSIAGTLFSDWDYSVTPYFWQNNFGQQYWVNIPTYGWDFEDHSYTEQRYGSMLNIHRANIDALGMNTQLSVSASLERQAIIDQNNITAIHKFLPIPPPDYAGHSRSIRSVSLEGKTALIDRRWQVIYGARVDDYSGFSNQTSPRFGVIWMPVTDFSVKALYGRAFIAPSAYELYGTNYALGTPTLGAESMDNKEITFTKVFNRSSINLVGFHSTWHDRVILKKFGLINQFVAAGNTQTQGVEFSANLVGDDSRLQIGATYLEDHGSNSNECHCYSHVMPSWILNIAIGHTFRNPKIDVFWSNYLHQKTRTGDDVVPGTVTNAPPYFRSDLSMHYALTAQVDMNVIGRNIFNRRNVITSTVNSHGGDADVPRQLGLELRYRF